MTPSEVLDAQGDLLDRLNEGPFCAYIDSVASMDFGRSGGKLNEFGYAAYLKVILKAAYAYRVTHDMTMMVEHAAASLDDLDRFDHTLAPSGAGFVAFDRGLPLKDARGKIMLIHYLIWGPIGTSIGPATGLMEFNDIWRQQDEVQDEMDLGVALGQHLDGRVHVPPDSDGGHVAERLHLVRAALRHRGLTDRERVVLAELASHDPSKFVPTLSVLARSLWGTNDRRHRDHARKMLRQLEGKGVVQVEYGEAGQVARYALNLGDAGSEGLAELGDDKDAVRAIIGRWGSVGAAVYSDEQRLGPPEIMPGERHSAALLADGFTPVPGTNPMRYIHALWLLMNQTITTTEDGHLERAARRRAGRRNLPPKVTVIRLRREAGAARNDGESLVEWAHRFVVRGHWRWQHVSEHHPMAQEIAPGDWRARIWINPYMKNADRPDLPLIQSEKVISLER